MEPLSAKPRLLACSLEPGNVSEHVVWLHNYLKERRPSGVVLYCRVSKSEQRLDKQELALRYAMQLHWLPVVAAYCETSHGWQYKRIGFDAAIAKALSIGPDVVIVAESVDRYVRHRDFDRNRTLLPNESDLAELSAMARGVTLTTVFDPGIGQSSVRYWQQNRVLPTAQEQQRKLREAWNAHGRTKNVSEIARILGKSRRTARRRLEEWMGN
ncbi:MAG: recombinase family protein [Pirellulales bacterium]